MGRKLLHLMWAVVTLGACVAAVGQEYDFVIPYADPAPVIDGVIDDVWLISSIQVIDEMETPVGATPTSLEDCSGYFRVLYDVEYLYVLVDVNDSQLYNDTELANSWQDDSVEVYFDGNNSKGEQGVLDSDDYQYRYGWNVEAAFDAFEYFVGAPMMEGMTYKMAETEDGYLFEIAFPWATLTGGTIPHGKVIGIDCFINDDDTGGDVRETQLSWHAIADSGWNTPAQWGTAWIPPILKAYNPRPADGADDVAQPLLQWDVGSTAVLHDVYFGTSPDLGPGQLVAPRSFLPMYWHIPGLESGTTYYWRVDEIEKDSVTVHTGDVWTFSTPPIKAHKPNPANGARWVDPESAVLAWSPGTTAETHDVYFGANADDVANGTGDAFKLNQPQMTWEPGTLEPATMYYWRVDEVEKNGTTKHTGDVWSFTTRGPEAGGVKGEYFNNMTLTGLPVLVRVDEAIDFDWGTGGPGEPVRTDTFSVRWSAELEVAFAETYTFTMRTTDGARLYIDGERLINQWQDQRDPTEASGKIDLVPGVSYTLVMEYYDNADAAVAQLFWQSASQPRQIIPAGPLMLPVRASGPYPGNGAVDVTQLPMLRWNAGDKTVTHDIYFGDDKDTVANATPATTGIYRAQQTLDATTYNPGVLEWNKTYYWRIDEVNTLNAESPWKGNVWSFTTADFIVVDNFESYTNNSPDRVFQTWVDGLGFSEDPYFPNGNPGNGSGAAVGHDIWTPGTPYDTIVEDDDVHGGSQAMPLYYNNAATPYYSEAVRSWQVGQDWTVHGVTDLSLWFKGSPIGFAQTADGIIMSATGRDIWDAEDEFRFAYKSLNGNGTLIARVDSVEQTDGWAKAGVMIRESLDANAQFAYLVVTPSQGVSFGRRPITGGTCEDSTEAGIQAPHWVKLTRQGNTITAQHSVNGTSWVDVADPEGDPTSVDLPMMGNVYIGLAVTSHNVNAVTTAEFGGITTSGGVSGQWQVAEIGTDHPANDQDDVYVALQDTGGRMGIVTHPDPAAVNIDEWTRWEVALSDFAAKGVNLNAISKMYIGVGNRNAPTPDGSGMLLVDDIRVVKPEPPEGQ